MTAAAPRFAVAADHALLSAYVEHCQRLGLSDRAYRDRQRIARAFLPTAWDDAWGGELELWDRARTRREVAIAPRRDRLVVMAYGEDHWHGHPAPLRCPAGHARAVIGAYYYVARAAPGDDDHAHGAIWAGPPAAS